MVDQTTLEQKRKLAAVYVGVSYDHRIDRFTAAVTVNGEKRYLGSYMTAGEASVAYDKERKANPFRRTGGRAQSIKKLMVAFDAAVERDADGVALAGQIFTAPDGQRFRVEGTTREKKRNWYVWSAPCRVCGALFNQKSQMTLHQITGMTRNCEAHHGQLPTGQNTWPDPVEWNEEPVVLPGVFLPKTDAATYRAHEAHKDAVFEKIKHDPKLVAEFYRIEKDIEMPFTHSFDAANEDDDKYAWLAMWNHGPDPYAVLLEGKMFVASTPNARLEDLGALAEEPPADNSDLV